VPGSLIRAIGGDQVRINFSNELPELLMYAEKHSTYEWLITSIAALVGAFMASEYLGAFSAFGPQYEQRGACASTDRRGRGRRTR